MTTGQKILDRHTRLLLGFVAIVLLCYTGLVIAAYQLIADIAPSDFLGLWSFGKFPLAHPAVEIYDSGALRPFQLMLRPGFQSFLPYPYPPYFLFFVIPFGLLAFSLARALWIGVTLVPYLAATAALAGGARRVRWLVACAALIAPLTAINYNFGQTGFLTSALLAGGLFLFPARPALGGILFGLLSMKPQLGVLVPVALLAAGAWRTIAAATLTVLALALAASLAFGWEMWAAWQGALTGHISLLEQGAALQSRLIPTVLVCLLNAGAPPWLAWTAQGCAFVIVAACVWRCYRRGASTQATAALMVGTFLATPYAFIYDMPAVSAAALTLLAGRLATHRGLPVAEVVVLLATQLAPVMVAWGITGAPLTLASLALLFGLAVARSK
jgi:hypothetical protein